MTLRAVVVRRRFLLGSALLTTSRRPSAAVPDAAELLAPGPDNGPQIARLERLASALSRGMPQATLVRLQILGGPDGVTAANRFATGAAPDGRSLLALPGAAAQSRLVGESRAKFDPGRWLPVCAGALPCALLGRGSLSPRQTPLRLAAAAPEAPETAVLLALEMLGIPATPVFGLAGASAEFALQSDAVDAFLVSGPDLHLRAKALGAEPWIAVEPAGGGREPTLPETPILSEMLAPPPAVMACLRAGMAAASLPFTLVLPPLTPGNAVAAWRLAADRWLQEEARGAANDQLRPLGAMQAAVALATLCPPQEASRAYRDWLKHRLNWHAT